MNTDFYEIWHINILASTFFSWRYGYTWNLFCYLVLTLRKMPEGSYKTLKIYLLANNTSSRFTMTRFNLQWTSNCLPHFWLAFFNIKYRDIYKRHLNASFFPKFHIIHSSLIWLGIAAPEEFSRPSRKKSCKQKATILWSLDKDNK